MMATTPVTLIARTRSMAPVSNVSPAHGGADVSPEHISVTTAGSQSVDQLEAEISSADDRPRR